MAADSTLAGPTTTPITQPWRRPLLLALGTVLALRVILSAWAIVVQATMLPAPNAPLPVAEDVFTPQAGGLAAPWEREDAVWYEKIALRGYRPNDGTTEFFPLLPLLMCAVSPLTGGNVALAGLLVSGLAAIAAFALLYRLVALDNDAGTAARTVAYLALFPAALFLYAAWTESLFLALTLGAFWCVRTGRWPVAAGLALLAGLTKAQGALLGLPLAVEYLVWAGWRPSPLPWPRPEWGAWLGQQARALGARLRQHSLALGALALAGAVSTLAFFAFLTYVVHDPLGYSARQVVFWHHRLTWPGETLFVAVQNVLAEGRLTINTFDLAVLLLFTVLTVAAFRLRLSYGLQAATILAFSWLHVNAEFPLMSISRYMLVAFPCFIVLALWAGRRPRLVHLLIIALWISWLLVLASQVVRGYWVA